MPEYKIIFETKDANIETSIDPIDIQEDVTQKTKKKEPLDAQKLHRHMLNAISKTTEIVNYAQMIADPIVQTIVQNHQMSGETLKSSRLDTNYSNITQLVGMQLSATYTLATGNPIGIAMAALQIAQRAYQLSLQMQRFTFEQSKDRYKSQYLSQRLVRNISEVR